jgi:hypothetical protein
MLFLFLFILQAITHDMVMADVRLLSKTGGKRDIDIDPSDVSAID